MSTLRLEPSGPPGMSRPVVYKFGGSSLADGARINAVAGHVTNASEPLVVVVSALEGVTDQLIRGARAPLLGPGGIREVLGALRDRHRQVLEEVCSDDEERSTLASEIDEVLTRLRESEDRREEGSELLDRVVSIGEDLSARLVAAAVRATGRDACVFDARKVIRTDTRFGRAVPQHGEIRRLARERLLPLLEKGTIAVVQGFVGAAQDGRTTTLGRGGSDLTAVLLGAALDADVVHIWTDVDGIMSGDPRMVDHPRVLARVGFEEAVELAYFGAKVIHAGAAKHAVAQGVALRIRNTFNPEAPGTGIMDDRHGGPSVAAIAYKPKVALFKVRSHPTALEYGFLARVFEVLGRHQVAVDLVATSHSSTAFTIDEDELMEGLASELGTFSDVEVVRGLGTVTVVGHGLLEEPGINALVFWAVAKTPVYLISQASDVSLSFLVAGDDGPAVVRKLHHALIELRNGEAGGEE